MIRQCESGVQLGIVRDSLIQPHFQPLLKERGTPRIDRVFPFAEMVEAHRYVELNEQIGKIVVTVWQLSAREPETRLSIGSFDCG